jgi:molybdopterin converting factor small subunit
VAVVKLRSPLRELAGGPELSVEGATVGEVIRRLEAGYPRLSGWVLDEEGHIREHVGVFLNDERAGLGAQVGDGDRIHILPAISGGAARSVPEARGPDTEGGPS